jgi:hypothetical protein
MSRQNYYITTTDDSGGITFPTSAVSALTQKLVGGPGFEPGASRSRTVVVACPLLSRRLPRCPPELKLPHLRVRPCPPRATWFRESVPRLCPGS